MTLDTDTFLASLSHETPPHGLSVALTALWLGLNGDWGAAHGLVQDSEAPDCERVHAWLHRIEGDEWNAGYWYRRAGVEPATGDTDDEGRAIARDLLR